MVLTYKPPKTQKDGKPAASQEERLLGLLCQAERYAYVLAHSCDIGGEQDRARGFVTLGERLREAAVEASVLARPDELHNPGVALVVGWQRPSVSPLVPQPDAEQLYQESQER